MVEYIIYIPNVPWHLKQSLASQTVKKMWVAGTERGPENCGVTAELDILIV